MLRFFACCNPLFSEDGVMPILDELFNRAADLQTESPDDVSLANLLRHESLKLTEIDSWT